KSPLRRPLLHRLPGGTGVGGARRCGSTASSSPLASWSHFSLLLEAPNPLSLGRRYSSFGALSIRMHSMDRAAGGSKLIGYESLGLGEAQRGIDAAVAEASARGRNMAFAVVDAHGDLIAAARMDGSHARVLRHAIRKAHTAATFGRNTLALKNELKQSGRELIEWGDAAITTLQGGLVVKSDGAEI